MITYQFECDWDNDGFICRDARPADAPNLLPDAARIDSVKRQVSGTGGSATGVFSPVSSNPYGLAYVEWLTGLSGAAFLRLGTNGSAYDAGAVSGEVIAGGVWVFNTNAAYNAVQVTLELRNQAGTVIATSAAATIPAGTWQRFTVSGTTPIGTTAVYLQLSRAGTTSAVFRLSGAMIVQGVLPAVFNTGFSSRYDDFTAYVHAARWKLGCDEPFQPITAREHADITLVNDTDIFSPESGIVAPQRRVYILATPPAAIQRVMFVGWISAIRPVLDAPFCRIELTGTRQFIDAARVHLALLQNVTAEEVADAVIAQTGLPRSYAIDGVVPPVVGGLEVAYPYAADNWMDGVKALNALIDIATARQGKIVFDRAGFYGVWTPRQLAGLSSAAVTLDQTMTAIDLRYGEHILNEITVMSYKRTVSAASDVVLWDAEETITLEGGESVQLRARYKSAEGVTVGGANVYLEITASGGVTSFIQADARSAYITLTNTNPTPASVTVLRVRGKKLTAFNEVEITASDGASIDAYGKLHETNDSRLVNTRHEARRIASYRLAQFKDPQSVAHRVTFIANDSAALENAAVNTGMAWNTVQRVRVIAGDHDRVYALVGEAHEIRDGLHETTWTLEPVADVMTLNDSLFGVIGQQMIGLY